MKPGAFLLLVLLITITRAEPVRGQVSAGSERRTVDRSRRLLDSGRTDEAERLLTDLLSRAPDAIDALSVLYDVAESRGALGGFVPYAEAAERASGGTAPIRSMWVSSLIGAGLPDSALHVASRWVEDDPSGEGAALGLAAAHGARGDSARAAVVLQEAFDRGIRSIRVEAARAHLLVALGRMSEALGAWSSLLTFGEPAIDDVAEDLQGLPDDSKGLDLLLHALESEGGTGAATGALLALRLGHGAGARRLAGGDVAADRSGFLRSYVREARAAGLPEEVAWAAEQLVFLSPRAADKVRWRALAADQSLAAGDTASARSAFTALARETRAGAGPHDAATKRLFELLAADPATLDSAESVLRAYATEAPDSVRARATMYGQLAVGYARGGDLKGAENILQGARDALAPATRGPIDAVGGSLSFWSGARDSMLARAGRSLKEPDLLPAARTARIRLTTVAQVADSSEIDIVGHAAYGLLRDPVGYDPDPALRALQGRPASQGRATALAYFGELAEAAGRPEVAEGLRRRVLDRFPKSSEAPGILLALARSAGGEKARQRLEQLIVGYPESALAPVARRLLAELGGGGPDE